MVAWDSNRNDEKSSEIAKPPQAAFLCCLLEGARARPWMSRLMRPLDRRGVESLKHVHAFLHPAANRPARMPAITSCPILVFKRGRRQLAHLEISGDWAQTIGMKGLRDTAVNLDWMKFWFSRLMESLDDVIPGSEGSASVCFQ